MALFKKKTTKKTEKEEQQISSSETQASHAHTAVRVSQQSLRYPLITEKTFLLSQQGQYVFAVNPSMSKIEAKKEIEKLYNVSVVSVRTLREKKSKGSFRGISGKTRIQKKVIVNLKKGQSIDITGNR